MWQLPAPWLSGSWGGAEAVREENMRVSPGKRILMEFEKELQPGNREQFFLFLPESIDK